MPPVARCSPRTYAIRALLSALALVWPGVHLAHAHGTNPPTSDSPFRCPKLGVCLDPIEEHSVWGGCRTDDEEVRFVALFRPRDKDASPQDANTFCLAFAAAQNETLLAFGTEAMCEEAHMATDTFGADANSTQAPFSPAMVGCLQHVSWAQPLTEHADAWAHLQAAAADALAEQAP